MAPILTPARTDREIIEELQRENKLLKRVVQLDVQIKKCQDEIAWERQFSPEDFRLHRIGVLEHLIERKNREKERLLQQCCPLFTDDRLDT